MASPNHPGTTSRTPSAAKAGAQHRVTVHSADLTIKEMLRLLVAHGSVDISSDIDPEGYSEYPIGVGGHGDVWKGRMRDGRDIAVKVWRQFPKTDLPKVMKRTMQEIYYWSKIRHEHIHELMGVAEHQGKLGIVSFSLEHGDLRAYIGKNPQVDRYPWCIQVVAGVSFLHQEKLVHGDLKASNVLLSKDHVAKISDFDCSIVSDCSLLFSATEQMRTSLRWAAPELMGSSGDEDETNTVEKTKKSDLTQYDYNQTLLEIISGESPYAEYRRDFGVLKALWDKKPPKRPEVLSESNSKQDKIWRLLVECWNHDHTARPDAQAVLELLQAETKPSEFKGPERVTSQMSVERIFNILVQHGCPDLTLQMDPRQKAAMIVSGGGFGDIWKGKLHNGAKVAIKTCRTDTWCSHKAIKRAAREVYYWSRLVHPNVHPLMGVIQFKGGYLGMVSEWMENGNLHEYMRKYPNFDRHQKCIEVTSGLEYMHHNTMVHGDLKAANVLVSSDDVAKLIDFDCSMMASEAGLIFSESSNSHGNSLRWVSPELLLEDAPVRSKPADVYALGMTFLEIFSGEVPYPECRMDFNVLMTVVKGTLPTRPMDRLGNDERSNKMPTPQPSVRSSIAVQAVPDKSFKSNALVPLDGVAKLTDFDFSMMASEAGLIFSERIK
ncbi:hypothetical protein RSAG8_07567, partial [Rhizoctonia solani AG-8 WAC10335]